MRWLITGAGGQLGTAVQTALSGRPEVAVQAAGSSTLDITNSGAVEAAVAEFGPDVIINAAAYTAVDAAESDEARAYEVNAVGPAVLAASAARHQVRLLHVSTDYVFSGDTARPYDVDDEPDPRTAYGRTKRAGELAVRELHPDGGYVVRTAWMYGAGGANFVKTMARLERERTTVRVVADQRGNPTWSAEVARGLVALGGAEAPAGIYHCASGGDATWFEFAVAIFAELGADPGRVEATTSAEFPRAAPRPRHSVLSDRAWIEAGLPRLAPWRAALSQAFASVGPALRG